MTAERTQRAPDVDSRRSPCSVLRELTVEVTRRCLNRCLHCSSRATDSASSPWIPTSTIARIIREAHELGIESLAVSGGEPFLHPELDSMLDAVVALPVNLSIYSSGVVVDPSGAPASLGFSRVTADRLRAAGTTLIFNVQSLNEGIHDTMVGGPGRLSLVLSAIASAVDFGLKVEAHVVPTRINLGTLKSTALGLVRRGVSRVSFLRFVPQGRGAIHRSDLLLDAAETAQLYSTIRELEADALASFFRFGIPFSSVTGHRMACSAGRQKLVVLPDGDAYPCEAFKECGLSQFRLGSVHDSSLESLHRHALKMPMPRHVGDFRDSCPAQSLYCT